MSRKKPRNYKFTKKKHSGPAAAALAAAFVPLLLLLYAVWMSYQQGGHAAKMVGCVGIASILIALLTLKVSIQEVRKENVIKRVPIMGTFLSILMLSGWTAVYVLGWIS